MLALSLARRGVAFRLVSAAAGPGEKSRAMAVHARTLEFYRQFGFADEVVAAGVPVGAMHLRERRRGRAAAQVARFDLRDMGAGLSAYPFVLAYPQDAHERLLIGKLAEAGGRVEWNTALTAAEQDESGIRATLAGPDGRTEAVEAAWLAGCDGAHSAVRHALGIGFPGGSYDQLFYVADVAIEGGFIADMSVTIGTDLLALMMPVRATGMQRLIGLVPRALSGRSDLTFDDLRGELEPLLGVQVATVNWFSTYRVHHRVAERFRQGRAFLLGDAAHVHSPAGGQGMNTGIGDAVNLGWKLADVIRGRAPAALLDSVEPERIAFARTLVATTDRAFGRLVAAGPAGVAVRRLVAPLAAATMARFDATRRLAFRALSQTGIRYPDSPLSEGRAGQVKGGDRLPWIATIDNHAPLASLDWQAHVHGTPTADVEAACAAAGLPLHRLGWDAEVAAAGLARDALYVVRPDGHVALAAPGPNASTALSTWIGKQGLRLR